MPKDEFDPKDPLEMHAVSIEGSFDEMADAVVDEFICMHFSQEALWELFRNPFYQSTHAIYQMKGEAYVQKLIDRGFERWAQTMAE